MTIIGNYEVQEEILARDGQGLLKRAKNIKTSASALVKELDHSSPEQGDAWMAISDPALLVPGETIKHKKSYYRIIEHPEGDLLISLLPTLRTKGIWGRYQMLSIFLSVCAGTAALHKSGRVHGAIHPGHILVGKDSAAYLLCFEPMQTHLDPDALFENEFLFYLSQEQLRGYGSTSSDIYALGVLLFQLFGSEPPYKGSSRYEMAEEIMWGNFQPFRPAQDGLDELRSGAILSDIEIIGMTASKAIQRDFSLRYPAIHDLQNDIGPIRDHLSPMSLGLRLYEQGNYGLSASVLEDAVLYQDRAAAYSYLGRIYGLHLNNYERGVLSFKYALKANPGLDTARLGLAELYSHEGRYALAKNEYVEMLTQRPNDLHLLMSYAQVLAQGGNPEGSLNILIKAQNENPYFLPAYIAAIQTAVMNKDFNKAESICNSALANILKVIDKGNLNLREVAQIYYERGALHRLQGRPDQALRWLNHALTEDPHHAASHFMLAELYSEKGEMALALNHFTMSLKLNPGQQGLLEGLERMFTESQ